MIRQRSLYKLVVLCAISILFPFVSMACHLAAADIYIEYAGKGIDPCDPNPTPDYTYKIVLFTYSSCECSLVTDPTETLSYQSLNGGTGVLTATLVSDRTDTIDQLCPAYSAINRCRVPGNSQYPAYKRKRYEVTVTLPSGQTDWKFWWSDNARNLSENLNGQGSLYIEAGMNVLADFQNNTPRFLSNPLPYICVGQEYKYLNIPFDPDSKKGGGSSVVVTNTTPLTGANTTVTYKTGYSVNNPINGYSLNTATGTATFFPIQQGAYTLSFRATDGMSYVLRDVQIAVLPCIAPPPHIDSVPQNLENASLIGVKNSDIGRIDSIVYVCPGSNMTFNINAWSDTPTNMVWLRSNYTNFNGATFTTVGDGTDKVTGTFTWTPTTSDYGTHLFVATAVDSTCNAKQPVLLTSNSVIQIKVIPGLDAGPDRTICEINPQPVQLFVKGTENLRLKWNVVGGGPLIGFPPGGDTINNPLIQYPYVMGDDTIFHAKTTGYVISTVDLKGACRSIDTVFVALDTSNNIYITPKNPNDSTQALVLCRPDYMQLEALIKGRKPLKNLRCGTSDPIMCSRTDFTRNEVLGALAMGEATYDTVGGITTPVMYLHLRTSKKEYLIRNEDMRGWGMNSGTIRTIGFEVIGNNTPDHKFRNFSIYMGCTEKRELNAQSGFQSFGMTRVFYGNAVTLENGWHEYDLNIPYNWDTAKNLIIQICYSHNDVIPCDTSGAVPRLRFAPTTYTSGLTLKPADSNTQDVCSILKSADVVAAPGRPVFRFAYCESDTAFTITWKDGEHLSDSTIAQPLAYIPRSDRFIVQTIGRSTCIMRDTLEVYVPEHDVYIQPEDTAVCMGEQVPYIVYGGHYFKWYEYEDGRFIAPTSVADPTLGKTFVQPQKTTEYRIVVSDSVFCYDTIAARLEIKPLPDVRILNQDDTTVKYGRSFQLLATGARYYNWSPVSPLNNPNISYPVATPKEDTRFIVGGIGSNGCRAFDTLHVIIDNRDPLFVPNVFSPNGDGRNDEFRVTNLTFQRIMEFRVFNRWGQEIFSTTDSRRGWDGTWQGKPQEIGVYSYLIRVGYPDGYAETYKGDVTLVR